MLTKETHYIYSIEHDMCDYPLYIGMTTDPEQRFKQHLTTNQRLLQELNELRICYEGALNDTDLSLEPHFVIYAIVDSLEEARKLERAYIHRYKPLLNTQHNQDAQKYHEHRQLVFDLGFVLLDAGVDSQDVGDTVDKILELVGREWQA